MPPEGVIWILAAIVWYSVVLYGGWPHNYKFGFAKPTQADRQYAAVVPAWAFIGGTAM
jgi:hypothetical protein